MEVIFKFFEESIVKPLGLPLEYTPYVVYGSFALALLVVVGIIIIIAVAAKKSKKKKAAAATVSFAPIAQVATPQTVEQSAPAAENVEVKETVVEEKKEEPVVEEQKVEEEVKKVEEKPVQKQKAEKTPAKKAPAKKQEEKPAPVKKQLYGKWVVEFKREGEYLAKLLASNGEVMLSSEIYTTADGAKSGVATIIKGVDSGKFVIYQDKSNNYYYKLKTASNRLLCVGEIYKSKEQCLKAVETVKRIAAGSTVVEEIAHGAEYAEYVPAQVEIKNGVRGKWRIDVSENGMYSAKLFANNGQLMLATEEVSLKKSAENALLSVKKNAAEGNFIIDHDKFGRYYYKLRNAQKSVICIGEAYDTLEGCTSAIESVRRFAATATIPTKE